MNREEHRAERTAQTQKTKQMPPNAAKPNKAATPPRRVFAICIVGLLVSFGLLFGLWSVNAATGASVQKKTLPSSLPLPLTVTQSSFTPTFVSPPLTSATTQNNSFAAKVALKTVEVEATPLPAPPPKQVMEADLNLDLSESNGGRTFDVGRISLCSQSVVRVNGAYATVGDLKVGDRIYLSGDNIGRVVSMTKKWHTPTPPKYDTKGNGYNRVVATTKRMTDHLLFLYTSAELVKTTPEHPFAVKGKGYVEAGRLQSGDVLETQDGKIVTVERSEVHNDPQLVYNLEVENAHNFFVGKNAILVHNGGVCVPTLNPFKGRTASEIDSILRAKKYSPRGPNPVDGFGGYVNPRTGRSIHIDPANSYGEPPHVDINRLRDYKGPLPKRKYPFGLGGE